MNKQLFIPKQNEKLPDFYHVNIEFINGKSKSFDIAQHNYLDRFGAVGILEILTKDNIWHNFAVSNIIEVTFDKEFSKVVDIKNEMEAKRKEEEKTTKVEILRKTPQPSEGTVRKDSGG